MKLIKMNLKRCTSLSGINVIRPCAVAHTSAFKQMCGIVTPLFQVRLAGPTLELKFHWKLLESFDSRLSGHSLFASFPNRPKFPYEAMTPQRRGGSKRETESGNKDSDRQGESMAE